MCLGFYWFRNLFSPNTKHFYFLIRNPFSIFKTVNLIHLNMMKIRFASLIFLLFSTCYSQSRFFLKSTFLQMMG